MWSGSGGSSAELCSEERGVARVDADGGTDPARDGSPANALKSGSENKKSSETRMLLAWREWLTALATDAEAAHAAAMAYKELDADAREVWLSALAQDAGQVRVPKIAVYAPLLAVEADPARRQRILSAMGSGERAAQPQNTARALSGVDRRGLHVVVLVIPLYLDFVQVLACGYRPAQGFEWVRHDPIVLSRQAPRTGSAVGDAVVETQPLKAVIDELALTVLAHRRILGELPQALEVLSDLFAPVPDESA